MTSKGPKTIRGMMRKNSTGDGRKKSTSERIFNGEINLFARNEKKKK